MRQIWINLMCSGSLLLVGCQSSVQQVLPQQGKTMKEVYEEFTGQNGTVEVPNGYRENTQRSADTALASYPPQAEDIRHLYPKLDNPDLFMYVRPHAVGESGAPVPAYITRFSLYRSTHYALPNETSATVPLKRGHHD